MTQSNTGSGTLILLGIGLWIMVGLKFYPLLKLGSAFKGLLPTTEHIVR